MAHLHLCDTSEVRSSDLASSAGTLHNHQPLSAGLRTGQLPRGLHKSTFFNMAVSYSVYHRAYLSTFASFILIARFILKSMDKICHAQNSNQSAGRVDVELAQQAEQVENYWRSVLKRFIRVITFSCERGENEIMGSAANGNYLGMLELLAQYDDFLKQHIQKHANLGSGHTNYLSSTIYVKSLYNSHGKPCIG